MRFRILIVKYINELDHAITAEYEKNMLEIMHKVDGSLEAAGKEIEANRGGRAAANLLNKLQTTSSPDVLQIINLVREDTNVKAINKLAAEGTPAGERLISLIQNLRTAANAKMETHIAESHSLAYTVYLTIVIVSSIGIIVAIILAIITIRVITHGLQAIINSLSESSFSVSSAANLISNTSQSLAEGSTEQAASLEQTSSALEEMASMTRQNADNALKTNETTQSNDKQIAAGAKAVTNMSQAMAEITNSAEQINHIIKTIEDIAFQTNLLALNAAVEAARAGEVGKGFAVVADEVRNLAGRSAQAARDTTQLIQTTIARVHNGSEIAKELDASFKVIEEGSQFVMGRIAEISSATNEQAQGVDQVNTAVAQMDKVTQSNAATAEESASAAHELSTQADILSNMVNELVIMIDGRPQNANASRPSQRKGNNRNNKAPKPNRRPEPVRAQIQDAIKSSTVKMVPPSEIIPLDEHDDF